MKEIWKNIVGYEGLYQVSNLGRVKSLTRCGGRGYKQIRPERILKQANVGGYLVVVLCCNGASKMMRVHRLVAQAFIPNPSNLPIINHNDLNKTNNVVTNLIWSTHQSNMEHAKLNNAFPKGENNTSSILTDEEVLAIYRARLTDVSASSLAERHGVDKSSVYDIWSGKRWRHITGAALDNRDWCQINRHDRSGDKNGNARVSAKQVCDIRQRRRQGESSEILAKEYGISKKSINDIIARRTWKNV